MIDERDEPPRQRTHSLGEPLDILSVDELGERVILLRAEIARIEAAIMTKRAALDRASAFFKT